MSEAKQKESEIDIEIVDDVPKEDAPYLDGEPKDGDDLGDYSKKVQTRIKKLKYDYVIDCSGYPKDYSDYSIPDFLPLNHALVHSVKEPGNWNYTYHQATKNGWMFGIPLKTRQGWGYLFNDNITKTKEAEEDISKIFGTKKLNLREFKFKPYRANNVLDNRIIKNGNKAIFYEPMEALSSVVYDNINRMFYDYILGQLTKDEVNDKFNSMELQNNTKRIKL